MIENGLLNLRALAALGRRRGWEQLPEAAGSSPALAVSMIISERQLHTCDAAATTLPRFERASPRSRAQRIRGKQKLRF